MKKEAPRFLFIKLKHFGDVLLLTPTLAAVRQAYPKAHIAVLVREGTEKILEGCGLIDAIHLSVPPEKNRRKLSHLMNQVRLLMRLRKQRYDFVFELTDGDRGRWLGAFCRARLRCASTYGWQPNFFWRLAYKGLVPDDWNKCHRVEKDHMLAGHFLSLSEVPPALVFHPSAAAPGFEMPVGSYVVLHPVSRWRRKAWPLERWAEVGRHLARRGLFCVISSGPDSDEMVFAKELCVRIGHDSVCTGGSLTWGQLGALIKAADLFVGIDTAAMHLAAACHTPIVALFGPSVDQHWHPWKARYEIVSPGCPLNQDYPNFMYDAAKRSMLDLDAAAVIAACDRMLAPAEVCA